MSAEHQSDRDNEQREDDEEKYDENERTFDITEYSIFNEESFLQIQNNDRSCTAITIPWGDFSNNIDWASDSNMLLFENNDQLKSIDISGLYNEEEEDVTPDQNTQNNIKAFFKAISNNRSIETFAIGECNLRFNLSNVFSDMSPFFENNNNLRNIGLLESYIGNSNYSLLASSLKKRSNKSSLRMLMIERDDNIKYKVAEELITSLEGYYNLVHLTLLDSSFGGRGSYIAISNILQDPRYKLKDLTLSCFDTDSEVMTILADALVKSRTLEVFAPINCPRVHQVSDILAKASFRISSLRSIDLSNSTFGMPGFRSLATCLEDPASSLQILRLNNCIMNDDEALAVGHAMATNTTLKVLELDSNNSVSLVSWGHILVCLQPSSSLEKLSVNQCNISDEILDILVHALVNNSTLKSLSIRTNYSISANAWRSFSVCLRNNSALEEVDMKNNNFNNGSVTALVSALQYDSVLHSLLMINTVEHGITRRSWQVLLNTLCNKSSIDALYSWAMRTNYMFLKNWFLSSN